MCISFSRIDFVPLTKLLKRESVPIVAGMMLDVLLHGQLKQKCPR